MIHDASTLGTPLELRADLCVVGSGPGGATVAMLAAEAGMRVVLLEAGELVTPASMDQREDTMFPRLFWESGGRTTADRAIRVHQGRGVGGSALHNLNLCKRAAPEVLAQWRQAGVDLDWDALYTEAEALIGVVDVPETMLNRHNLLFREGARALGWANGPLRHNREGCVGSGFCEIGCAFDAKNNALKVCIPRAVRAGASVLARCQAVRVLHDDRVVHGVEAAAIHPVSRQASGEIRVLAPQVCVSASATGTPALLRRSGVPGRPVGDSLRMHPAVVVAGDFDERVEAWRGVPQGWECTEHLRFDESVARTWLVPAFAHPVGTATLVPGVGEEHAALMARYAHLGAVTAMVHDSTRGRVRPSGDLGLSIHYAPDSADRAALQDGLVHAARLLFAAGARRVLVPSPRLVTLDDPRAVDSLRDEPSPDLSAVHPMATVPLGEAVDLDGAHRELRGLWVADASLFPSSTGGPPQLTTYALGLHVGRAFIQKGVGG